jgi:hypothetical protein
MPRRKRKDGVKPYSDFAYGSAFDAGHMQTVWFDGKVERYTLDELRAAWAKHRDEHFENFARYDRPCWAELVFDDGVDPDEARAIVYERRGWAMPGPRGPRTNP